MGSHLAPSTKPATAARESRLSGAGAEHSSVAGQPTAPSQEAVVLNFAYGSNLLSRRIHARVPSARVVARGVLRGHELRWHKVGQDGSAKCDVVATGNAQSRVFGVVYAIAAAEKPRLDKAEGLGAGYAQRQAEIETDSGPVNAWLYHATAIEPGLIPFDWYKALVVAGAREQQLPAAYVAWLEATAAREDRDFERSATNHALASAG